MPNNTPQRHGYGYATPDPNATGAAQAPAGQAGAYAQPQQGQPNQAASQAAYARYGQPAYPGAAAMPPQGYRWTQAQYVPPATSQPQPVQKASKRGKGFWIAIVIIVLALIAAGIIAFNMLQAPASNRAGSLGQLENKTYEEIQAELDRVVEDGMFNISIASAVTFEDGTSEGELKIENVPGNRYLMQVDILRNDNGELIYSSGVLEPNYHIQWDKLAVDLDPGEYECTATFTAMDPSTEEEIGTASAIMNVQVLN